MRKTIGCVIVMGIFLMAAGAHAQDKACNETITNPSGTAGADVTVDGTARVVIPLTTVGSCCAALIYNNSANGMRCASDVTPTATVGYPVAAGASLPIGPECYHQWKCIETTASAAAASVLIEGRGQAQ